jgi:hypothetical protein
MKAFTLYVLAVVSLFAVIVLTIGFACDQTMCATRAFLN